MNELKTASKYEGERGTQMIETCWNVRGADNSTEKLQTRKDAKYWDRDHIYSRRDLQCYRLSLLTGSSRRS